jgi:inner membrane protein involved in colicin E2 resistance
MDQIRPPLSCNSKRTAHRWWKWGFLMIALVSLKIYYVREMIAALVIFSVLFAVVGTMVLVVFILDRISQRTFAWAESGTEWLARRVASYGGAIVEEFRRRRLHNLQSRIGP